MANLVTPGSILEQDTIQARSFGGCNTCRNRRVKCDEARPTCAQCSKSRIFCGGYDKSIFFDFEEGSGDDRTRFRRPLFSERARREMSEQLTSTIPYRQLVKQLAQIDEECQIMPSDDDVEVSRGPFGAFKVAQSGPPTQALSRLAPVSDESTTQLHDAVDDVVDEGQELVSSSLDWLTSMPVDSFIHFILNPSEQELPPDFANFPDPSSYANIILPGSLQAIPPADLFDSTNVDSTTQDEQLPGFIPFSHGNQPALPTSIPSILTPHEATPKNAIFLLQYFSDIVIKYLTPIRHEKTLWHILFLPHARDCLALLTLGQPVNDASLCVFYGILAISGRSMGGAHQSEMWLEQGEMYKQQAYRHREVMLRGVYDLPKKFKYKTVLMALQIMILISTLSGDPVTEEYYFLEAEKFIKLKGLGRKKSRKVRLLHQCYAFDRLMYESTCMRGIDFKNRHRVTNDIKSVSLVPYPEDSMAFRPANWHNLDEEISQSQSPESNDNEIDNEVLGLSPDALYSKVSGLPKHWILLILHIVLLGKEKDAVEQNVSSGNLQLGEFLRRAKTLERSISLYILQDEQSTSPRSNDSADDKAALRNMLETIKYAIQIYFYRRIYDVNTSWLQDSVLKVRDCLLRCETIDPDCEMMGAVGVLWASFVASCEAEDVQIQESFAGWYKRATERTGMVCWNNSLDLSQQLWNEKRSSNGTKSTWIDLLRRHQRQRLRAYVSVT